MRPSLLIANDFPPVTSGIATAFAQLWRSLPAGRTRIVAPDLPDAGAFDAGYPLPVHRVRLPLGEGSLSKVAKTLLTLAWVLVEVLVDRPSRIHCGQVFSSGLCGWLCREAFGISYVVWVYGSETARLARGGIGSRLMDAILEGSDWVVTNSKATSEEFRRFGVASEKIKRVYPGVDPQVFRPLPADADWVARLGLEGRKVILTQARLDQRKGHDMVLKALALLHDRRIVYLIGGTGREASRLRDLSEELDLLDQVRFLGFVSEADLPTVYNLCDAFVMPNRVTEGTALAGDIEGFGISFLEAGACAKPVIAGRSGGAVEAVIDGRTGLLVDPHSEEEIAAAIRRLLEEPDLSRSLGERARARIEREFDWRILARQVEEIL